MKKHDILKWAVFFWASALLWGCGASYQKATRHFQQGEYQTAIEQYKLLITKGKYPSNVAPADVQYLTGEAYRRSNRIDLALPHYQEALNLGYSHDSLLFVLAQAYKATQQYGEARKLFAQYAKVGSNYEAKKLAQVEMASVQLIDSLRKPNPYIALSLCDSINTDASEYAPAFWKEQLVFTSSRGDNKVYAGTGTPFTNLYTFTPTEEQVCGGKVSEFNAAFNTNFLHEAAATFSADGTLMVFARSNPGKKKDERTEVDLYMATFDGAKWSEPILLALSRPDSWDASPALSPDGKTLYFASNRPGAEGGIDIFKATRSNDGQFKGVTPLGKPINTPGNELFPFVTPNNTLYFASDGHPGLGGLDLFRVQNLDSAVVENLGAPFNSPKDDFALVQRDEKTGYFTSNRSIEGAKGDDDLYHFVDNSPTADDVKYFLAGTTFNLDYDNQETLLTGATVVLQDESGTILEQQISDTKGRYRFSTELTLGELYKLNGQKVAHFPDSTRFDTEGKGVSEEEVAAGTREVVFETRLTLKEDLFGGKLETDEEVVLKNILYDLDKADIRPDAAKELDKLVQYMKDKSDLKIELGSHTDVRGNDAYNMRLSQRRAESAVRYIVERGIDATRITARGYGETKLLIEGAQTEEEHQQNRRTTVKVIE